MIMQNDRDSAPERMAGLVILGLLLIAATGLGMALGWVWHG